MNKNTGRYIQEIAQVAGLIGMVFSVISGIAQWMMTGSDEGYIAGLITAAIGVFISWVLIQILRGFGEIVENSNEQTKLLRNINLNLNQVIQKSGAIDTADKNRISDEIRPVTAERMTASEIPGHNEPEAAPEKEIHTASFSTRSVNMIECPVCNKMQMPSRNCCYFCGCRFIFDQE